MAPTTAKRTNHGPSAAGARMIAALTPTTINGVHTESHKAR